MKLNLLILSTIFALWVNTIEANNVLISNVSLNWPNAGSNYSLVKFNISWENSWRVSTGPSNWDAAWVFVKYRKQSQNTWNHATLNWVNGTGSGDGHTEPTNTDISSSNDNGAGGAYGVFIRPSADKALGSVNYSGVQLRWNYALDGLTNGDAVEVRVFAIEMVYVPQGSFYVGDGSSTINGQFESGTTGAPLQITSEGALTLGGGGAGSLGNHNKTGMVSTAEDFDDVTSQSLPAAFPKGYNHFYCMKYEITQAAYVSFLNTLTYSQQVTRTATAPNSTAGTGAVIDPNAFRNGIEIKTPGVSTTTPAVYACNLDGDGIFDEPMDGENIASNYLSWGDITAYLDWAALRPMTELEFEKACRGPLSPVADEFAWGSSAITGATGFSNGCSTSESASNAGAQCAFNNHASVQGPMRVGCFGQGVNTRLGIGASYYGIMELSGNVYERSIAVGRANGRPFTGSHGNGALDAAGSANVTGWPAGGNGANYRGGGWSWGSDYQRISDRYFGSNNFSGRTHKDGGRGMRTAP